MTKLSLVSIIFAGFIQHSRGKFSAGIIDVHGSNFEYVDSFCFVSNVGELEYELAYPARLKTEKFYLYYDGPDQWLAVYKTNTTCQEKEGRLKRENYQIMDLTDTSFDPLGDANCAKEERRGEPWVVCRGSRRFSSYRERWWYMALGNCENGDNETVGDLYLEYTLTMTNGPKGSFYFHHFSADKLYILQVDIGFLVLDILTLVNAISLAGKYALDGIGAPSESTGRMLHGGARITFLLLLILMGKGITITRSRLSCFGSTEIAIFIALYSAIYSSLFIYEAKTFDPARVLHPFDSPVDYGIPILGLVGWAWFCRDIYGTLQQYPEKRGFYRRFCFFFSIWFWTGPVTLVLSNWILPNWRRERVVNGLENAITFLGYAAFMVSLPLSQLPEKVRMTKMDEVFTISGKAAEIEELMRTKSGRVKVSTEEELHTPPPPYDDCVASCDTQTYPKHTLEI